MNESELAIHSGGPAAALVPTGYAEKAMASLMQLHSELMDEKERRVDLYRRLMEKEQAIAELRMYVKLLEEKVERARPEPAREAAPPPPAQPEPCQARPSATPPPPIPIHRAAPRAVPPPIPRPPARRAVGVDGWKSW